MGKSTLNLIPPPANPANVRVSVHVPAPSTATGNLEEESKANAKPTAEEAGQRLENEKSKLAEQLRAKAQNNAARRKTEDKPQQGQPNAN